MRLLTSLVLLTLLVSMGCNKETCTSDDFTGTYIGELICNPGTSDEEVTVTVERITDSQFDLSVNGNYFIVDIDGCKTKVQEETLLGTGVKSDVDFDGKTLTVDYKFSILGLEAEDCTFVGELQ